MKLLFLTLVLLGVWSSSTEATRAPLDEVFGYVDVRPGAHMFWVTYSVDHPGDWTEYPLIMWLQGGPGASGVGYGNFEELGPYFTDGSIRETAWTKKANVMFVDNPVGTGYSYVDDFTKFTRTNQEIADDLVTLLKSAYEQYPDFSKMPFYVYCESYGGKMTVDFALALDKAIKAGEIPCDFKGVALGDSWISPADSTNTWGMYLYHMGFVNSKGQAAIDKAAAVAQTAIDTGDWEAATDAWAAAEGVVFIQTGGVNWYNVLATEDLYKTEKIAPHTVDLTYMRPEIRELYNRHVRSRTSDPLDNLMNGAQADRWNIPAGVVWDGQGGQVFSALSGDFMKPVINSVVELVDNTDIHVAVFTGDLDLICDTPGTYMWIENMEWAGKLEFEKAHRKLFHVPQYGSQAGYVQSSDDFEVYTILRSGHMVPIDAPYAALEMIDMITAAANLPKKQTKADVTKVVKAKVNKKLREEVVKEEETKSEHTHEEAPTKKEETHSKVVKEVKAKKVVSEKKQKASEVAKAKVAPVHVTAKAKAAHAPVVASSPHISHVTPTGHKIAKTLGIDRKLKKNEPKIGFNSKQ